MTVPCGAVTPATYCKRLSPWRLPLIHPTLPDLVAPPLRGFHGHVQNPCGRYALNYQGNHMQARFKTGDIVKLKSGGPEMTVQREGSTGRYNCQWFAGKKLESGVFDGDSIEITAVKPASPIPGGHP